MLTNLDTYLFTGDWPPGHTPYNIKKMFVPSPGFTLIEGDLKGAETQVVAWESGSSELKKLVTTPGYDLHRENAKYTFEKEKVTDYQRDRLKRCVYAIQNGCRPTKCSQLLSSTKLGVRFFNYWTKRFPEIPDWHDRLMHDVQTKRRIVNIYGFHLDWFDRVNDSIIGDLVPFITQSTIAITINKALRAVDLGVHEAQLLLQVHDSLVMQARTNLVEWAIPRIKKAMLVPVPYPDPLVIPVDFKVSEVSWGDAQKLAA